MTKVEIQKEALGLPEAERLHLADVLVESVAPFSLDEAEAGQARSGPKGLPGQSRGRYLGGGGSSQGLASS